MKKHDEQFDPTGYLSYRYHGSMLYIDPKATKSDIKAACPLFFDNAHRGEKRTMYRGHIICQYTHSFSDRIPRRMMNVYAFDVRRGDTFMLEVDGVDLKSAKQAIDAKLDTPEPDPLTLSHEVVEMMVPVKVRAAVFRDANGKTTGVEVEKILHVGRADTRQQDQPGDTFTTEVWSRLPGELKTPA